MDSIVRNVAELSAEERRVYESVLGKQLHDSQRIVVQLVNAEPVSGAAPATNAAADILEPYAMWAEFSDEEIEELESAILIRSESRPMYAALS